MQRGGWHTVSVGHQEPCCHSTASVERESCAIFECSQRVICNSAPHFWLWKQDEVLCSPIDRKTQVKLGEDLGS